MDPLIGSALIGAGSDLLGTAFSAYGQSRANAANMAIMREQQMWEAAMRSTRYQAAVQDLKQAGLNPILALGGNPGNVPGVQSAQMQNVLAGAGKSTMPSAQAGSAVAVAREQRTLLKEQVDLTKAQKLGSLADALERSANSALRVYDYKNIETKQPAKTLLSVTRTLLRNMSTLFKGAFSK